jgi:hypothetical protein
VGLRREEFNRMRSKNVLVSVINLNLDVNPKRELKDLAIYQGSEPRIQKIKQKLTTVFSLFQNKYMLKDDKLYCKDDRSYPYWRVHLPSSLEKRVIGFVQTS